MRHSNLFNLSFFHRFNFVGGTACLINETKRHLKIRICVKITDNKKYLHYVKNVHIRSFFGSYFPTFGLNTKRYGVSFRIQSECGKIRTRKTPNTNTLHTVLTTSFWLKITDCIFANTYKKFVNVVQNLILTVLKLMVVPLLIFDNIKVETYILWEKPILKKQLKSATVTIFIE